MNAKRSPEAARRRPVVGQEIRRASPSRFPVPFYQRSYYRSRGPSNTYPRTSYNVKTFNITLAWPSFDNLLRKLRRRPKKFWLACGIIIAAVIALIICLQLFTGNNAPPPPPGASHATVLARRLPKGTPPYATILPAGKTIQQLGGWYRVSPPNANPVYTYADKIGSTTVDVSEQPLPASFTSDPASSVEKLATSFNATNKFTAGNNTEVFVAETSANSQSAILVKNGLLVLIKASGLLSNNQWATYVSSLGSP